jgi:hypothetical protein
MTGGEMKTYSVRNTKTGADFGTIQARSKRDALERIATAAGYLSNADANRRTGTASRDLKVELVSSPR